MIHDGQIVLFAFPQTDLTAGKRGSRYFAADVLKMSEESVPMEVIEALSRIPRDYHERGDVSLIQLLKESGYTDHFDQITEKDLAGHFRGHPDLVRTWLIYSQDQRCSPAWYFLPPGDTFTGLKGWAVGHYPECQHHEFQDGAEACGFYVKRWAEDVRSIIEKAG